jgi:drug/metabolite transporter (DMT)-like permease
MRTTEQAASRQVLLGVAFALAAALSYGSSQVLTRHSVSELAPALVGSTVALIWGTVGLAIPTLRGLVAPGLSLRRGSPVFLAAGVFSALGVIGLFQALAHGPVVVVSPVVSTNPLFTLLWAAIFLREVERINLQVFAGALLVVAGVVVLTAT